ncbi:hypothetical protein MOC48_20030, partial [Bacillus haynesii]|uniref:hypothetical protein n=1 Tax=Bacillus haynesii TaxID=1925021 RepID=UPI00227F48B4
FAKMKSLNIKKAPIKDDEILKLLNRFRISSTICHLLSQEGVFLRTGHFFHKPASRNLTG